MANPQEKYKETCEIHAVLELKSPTEFLCGLEQTLSLFHKNLTLVKDDDRIITNTLVYTHAIINFKCKNFLS